MSWTALAHRPLAVNDRRRQLLTADERPLAAVLRPNVVPLVIMAPRGIFWCPYTPKAQPFGIIDDPRSRWRLSSTTNGRRASAVHGKKSCAFDIDRHQRRGLRVVEAEGTAFGAMAAARRRLQTENMGAGGQSSMVVSGTTLVKRYSFRRVSIVGIFLPPEPYPGSCHAKQRITAKYRHVVYLVTVVIDL